MVTYIYILEDGSLRQSKESPSEEELSYINDGILQVLQCVITKTIEGQEEVFVWELDEQGFKTAVQECNQ